MLNLSASVDDVHAGVAELLWKSTTSRFKRPPPRPPRLTLLPSQRERRACASPPPITPATNGTGPPPSFWTGRRQPSIPLSLRVRFTTVGSTNPRRSSTLRPRTTLTAVETVLLVNGVATAYTGSSTTLALPDGTSTIGFQVTDHAGLTAYQEFDVRVDTVVPGCELSSEVPSTAWSNDASREITAQYWAGNSSVVSATFTLNGQVIPGPNPPTLFNIPLENGINTLSIVQTGATDSLEVAPLRSGWMKSKMLPFWRYRRASEITATGWLK